MNCNNTGSVYDNSCWGTLDLTYWFSDCQALSHGSNDDGSNCCEANDNQSTCFLRLAKGEDGFNCTETNNGFCTFDPNLSSTVNARVVQMVHYVVKILFSERHPFEKHFQL